MQECIKGIIIGQVHLVLKGVTIGIWTLVDPLVLQVVDLYDGTACIPLSLYSYQTLLITLPCSGS